MKKEVLTLALVAAITSFAESAKAASTIPNAISVVSAFAGSSGDNLIGNGSISRVFDGSGLSVADVNDNNTWLHDTNWETGWQGRLHGQQTTWVVADLGANFSNLHNLYLWNVSEGATTGRGVRQMDIYYSSSPVVSPLTDSGYDFSSGGWVQLGSTFTIPEGTDNPAGNRASSIINLGAIPTARYIGFDLLSNYNFHTDKTGLAEVQITTIPEPSTFGIGVIGMLMIFRRKRIA